MFPRVLLKILSLEGMEGKFQRAIHSLEKERESTSALREEVECRAAVEDRMMADRACLLSDVGILRTEIDRLKAKLADVELSFGEWWIDLASYMCAPL